MRVPHQLVIFAAIGLSVASLVRVLPSTQILPSAQINSSQIALNENALNESAAALDAAGRIGGMQTERLVQEPSRRTSKRPQIGSSLQHGNQRTSMQMLSAFREAIGSTWQSTVDLFVDDERVAYGAVVDKDGLVITKDSQLPRGGRIVCRFSDRVEAIAEIVDRNSSLDIALLRVAERDLIPIQWSEDILPQRGNWVATTDTHSTPVAVGVVSAGLLSVSPKKAVLGVKLRDAKSPNQSQSQAGAIIAEVMAGTGADMAGLRVGDRIRAIDGKQTANQRSALDLLHTCTAGQTIKLAILRGEDELETSVQLMDLSPELHDETEMEVNGLISARSNGFNTVLLHDTVLTPTQCGGPLVNLEGRVIGLNIARAGRVSSYALPVSVLRPEVERMVAGARKNQTLPTRSLAQPVR